MTMWSDWMWEETDPATDLSTMDYVADESDPESEEEPDDQ